jgi:predicted nucleotidyltransferase
MKGANMKKKPLSLDEVLGILKKRKSEFETAYGVTAIGIFGSLARDEAVPDSDVDVVVKMAKPDLFFMVHIKEELEDDYNSKVDIVHYREKMNAFLKKRIDREAVYV